MMNNARVWMRGNHKYAEKEIENHDGNLGDKIFLLLSVCWLSPTITQLDHDQKMFMR